MAWSFGHWLILIVALVAGLAAGWVLRGLRDAAAAGDGAPTVEGDPLAGGTAVVSAPAPAATIDDVRPEASVDPVPAAVADHPGDATPASADASPAAAVATDRVDGVDLADMALTGDPAPAPDQDRTPATAAPVETVAGDGRSDTEVVLSGPAPVTGPAGQQAAADAPADAETTPVEPELTGATPAEPAPSAVEPVSEPAEPVVVPAPRAPEATPPAPPAATGVEAADDFRRIQGVGPKMAAALQAAGIRTYRQLAELDEAALRDTIRAAGLRPTPSLATWPQQAKLLADGPSEATAALPGGAQA